jgi:hypothetical protein
MKRTALVLVVLAVFAAATVIPVAAQPNPEGRQNTAIAASALAALLLGTGNWIPGLITGGGAWYAWDQYNKARDYQRYNNYYYGQPYGRGYYGGYDYGYPYGAGRRYYDPYSGRYYYGR